ncbi:MAG: hypothetical protein DWQ45_14370 [Planctomycetota bacterium]|nr:MAG: hypothetical protein DWQ45_14370 [Planctomycetota bacterium]
MIETRTNAYQVRRNEFAEESISVYFTVRQYGSLSQDTSYPDALDELSQDAERLLNDHVVGEVLQPLAQAIATK